VGAQTVLTERFSGQRVRVDPYTLLGMTLHWDATRHAGVYARIENLLGKSYETAYDRKGIPRTAALGLRIMH
jgi:outer membrane cobalamin receptor